MLYELNSKELEEFALKYMPVWLNDIYKVSRIEYNSFYEYLVNDHFLITVTPSGEVIEQDLQ